MKKQYVPILVVLAVLFLALAVYYWVTPANNLPSFVPGHEASTRHHLKHGLAALIVSAGLFIWAWFASGSKEHPTSGQNKSTE